MNRLIFNPFNEITFPQAIEDSLEGNFVNIRCLMHPIGKYLASGCNDGSVLVWDLTTKNILRILKFHSAPITCLMWFEKSHILLSASMEGTIVAWDVLLGAVMFHFDVSKPITSASFLPSDSYVHVQV